MTFGNSLRLPVLCGAASLVAMSVIAFSPIAHLEDAFADHVRYAQVKSATGATVLVTVDENVVRRHGKFPFDRSELALALENINKAGAKRVYVDAGLSAVEDREGDSRLQAAIADFGVDRIALPVTVMPSSGGPQTILPLPEFSRKATLVASEFLFDSDGRVRRVGRMAGLGHPFSADWLNSSETSRRAAPLMIDYSFDIRTLPSVDIAEAASGKVNPSLFAGRNVIIGLKIPTPQYTMAVPGTRLSRVEVLALASETVAAREIVAQQKVMQTIPVVFAVALAVSASLYLLPAALGFLLATTAALLWIATVDTLQRLSGIGMPVLAPPLAIVLLWSLINYRDSRVERYCSRLKARWFGTGAQALYAAADVIAAPAAVFTESGKPLYWNDLYASAGLDSAVQTLPDAKDASRRIIPCDARGVQRTYDVSSRVLMTTAGPLTLATFYDVTDRARREGELSQLAFTDKLTGLANRVAFHSRLTIMGEKAAEQPFSLLVVDLDGFKRVNDTLGHHAGDLLLAAVAARLQAVIHPSDMAARLGGDEFVVILATDNEATVRRTATRMLASLSDPFEIEGQIAKIGGSIGIAFCPQHADNPNQVLKLADAAMYAAKRQKASYAMHDTSEIKVVKAA